MANRAPNPPPTCSNPSPTSSPCPNNSPLRSRQRPSCPGNHSPEGARRGVWLGRREGANRSVARCHVRIRARPRTTPDAPYRPAPLNKKGGGRPPPQCVLALLLLPAFAAAAHHLDVGDAQLLVLCLALTGRIRRWVLFSAGRGSRRNARHRDGVADMRAQVHIAARRAQIIGLHRG